MNSLLLRIYGTAHNPPFWVTVTEPELRCRKLNAGWYDEPFSMIDCGDLVLYGGQECVVLAWRNHFRPEHSLTIYRSFDLMWDDLKSHAQKNPNCTFMNADSPPLLGVVAFDDLRDAHHEWLINLRYLELSDTLCEELGDRLSSADGLKRLVDILNQARGSVEQVSPEVSPELLYSEVLDIDLL